jgi:acyl dehydratase
VKGGLLRGIPVIHQRRPTTADEEEESTALDGDFNPLTVDENVTLESEKLQVKKKLT